MRWSLVFRATTRCGLLADVLGGDACLLPSTLGLDFGAATRALVLSNCGCLLSTAFARGLEDLHPGVFAFRARCNGAVTSRILGRSNGFDTGLIQIDKTLGTFLLRQGGTGEGGKSHCRERANE